MKVVVKGQSSEARVINANVHQCCLFSPTLILLYINDIANILRYLWNIYAGDRTGYRYTSKDMDDQNLVAYLSSDLVMATKWENDWLVTFNIS